MRAIDRRRVDCDADRRGIYNSGHRRGLAGSAGPSRVRPALTATILIV
jgi:hypothetical protein